MIRGNARRKCISEKNAEERRLLMCDKHMVLKEQRKINNMSGNETKIDILLIGTNKRKHLRV